MSFKDRLFSAFQGMCRIANFVYCKSDGRRYVVNAAVELGSCWEVEMPNGNLVDVLVLRRLGDYAQVAPMSASSLHLAADGDLLMCNEQVISVAHLWIQGLVLMGQLRRCFGNVDMAKGSRDIELVTHIPVGLGIEAYRSVVREVVQPIFAHVLR